MTASRRRWRRRCGSNINRASRVTFFPSRRPVGRSLGRPEETTDIVRLADFDPSRIDMMTVVLIGSSASRAFRRGDGRLVAYTPRGYARKAEVAE